MVPVLIYKMVLVAPLQDRHCDVLNYEMMLVVAPCRTDMVPISTTSW